jgi:hypothetical protein
MGWRLRVARWGWIMNRADVKRQSRLGRYGPNFSSKSFGFVFMDTKRRLLEEKFGVSPKR